MNKRIMKKKIRELLLAELAMRFEGTADAVQWLETANPALEGRTPREAIAGGDVAQVTLVLEGMAAPAPR